MKRLIVIALTLAVLCLMLVISAAEETCDAAAIQAKIEAQLERLEDEPLKALFGIMNIALEGFLECGDDNYSFSGTHGAQPVLGPIGLSPGYYILAMTTDGAGRVVGTALEGCGKDVIGTLQSFSESQAIGGAENLFLVEDECTLYLEISKISAPWTLTIDKIR